MGSLPNAELYVLFMAGFLSPGFVTDAGRLGGGLEAFERFCFVICCTGFFCGGSKM